MFNAGLKLTKAGRCVCPFGPIRDEWPYVKRHYLALRRESCTRVGELVDPFELIPPLLAVVTALSLGGMALIGIRMWTRRLPGSDPKELAESIRQELQQDIRDEVAKALESRDVELEELHERLDFTERLLAQGKPSTSPEQRDATPV